MPENTTAYLPSAPTYATTTTTAPTTTATQIRFTTLWGIPVWAVAVIGGLIVVFVGSSIGPVSYTHLDVYKRQPLNIESDRRGGCRQIAERLAPFIACQGGLDASALEQYLEK